MKKIILCLFVIVLSSCGIRTMNKFIEKSSNIFLKGVESTLKGMDWVYEKANGKINEDRINGRWKIVGLFDGDFETFKSNKNPKNLYRKDCNNFIIIDTKSKYFQQINCEKEGKSTKYNLVFDRDIDGKYANIFKFGVDESFNIINANNKNMILEGYFIKDMDTHSKGIYILEKIK